MSEKDSSPPDLRLVIDNTNPEETELEDVLREENIHLVGVLKKSLNEQDIEDSVTVIERTSTGYDQDFDDKPDYVYARKLLIMAEIIIDPIMVADSPNLQGTRANMAKVITSKHLKSLNEAYAIEQAWGDMSADEKREHTAKCSLPYLQPQPNNISLIVDALYESGKLPKYQLDSIRRMVGFVAACQMERQK